MESKILFLSHATKDTYEFGTRIAKKFESGEFKNFRVVCLRGILGSGKTVFAKGFLEGLGVKSRILSPTYTISKSYEIHGKMLWHFDLYRMQDASEVSALGIKEVLSQPGTIVLVEWPEKIMKLLPKTRIEIDIDVTGDVSRDIRMTILKKTV